MDASPITEVDCALMSKTATITGTQKMEDENGKSYTVYCILVTTYERETNHHIYHRYREFDVLAKSVS